MLASRRASTQSAELRRGGQPLSLQNSAAAYGHKVQVVETGAHRNAQVMIFGSRGGQVALTLIFTQEVTSFAGNRVSF